MREEAVMESPKRVCECVFKCTVLVELKSIKNHLVRRYVL